MDKINYLFNQMNQYWSALVALIAFVTALLVVIIKWQTIKKNRLENWKREEDLKERGRKLLLTNEGARFEKIRIDTTNRYWTEWRPSSSNAIIAPAACPYTFSVNCKQFFHLNQVISGADPSFDVILFNPGDIEVSILAVGVQVERVIHYSYSLPVAGDIPKAEKLTTSETYSLIMPDIFGRVRHLDFDDSDTPAEIKELVKEECDPYVLQPGARFRYTLAIRNYDRMPSDTILRLWIETNVGDKESHEIYMRQALSFPEAPLTKKVRSDPFDPPS